MHNPSRRISAARRARLPLMARCARRLCAKKNRRPWEQPAIASTSINSQSLAAANECQCAESDKRQTGRLRNWIAFDDDVERRGRGGAEAVGAFIIGLRCVIRI